MRIGGFQKLSLIDYPGTICAVIFTQGCNFRCPYCHNPELVDVRKDGAVPEEEVLQYLEAHADILQGVCVTGGEPTLQHDLPAFLEKIKALGLMVKLDTNGTNPAMVEALLARQLVDYIAMDLKHTWSAYEKVAHAKNTAAVENCKKTFGIIQQSGVDHEFRTTVLPGTHRVEDFIEMAGYLRPGERYYLQNVRLGKTLDPGIEQEDEFSISGAVVQLRRQYPCVSIEVR